MEQQETKLPLEWLSSRRTPELHRLEALCRENAREERCAQRRLQEVEEAMAPEPERSCPAPAPEAAERAKLCLLYTSPAAAQGSTPRPTGPGQPAAAPSPGRAAPPQGAAARCFSPQAPPPSRSAASRPSPRSARSPVSYPRPPVLEKIPHSMRRRRNMFAVLAKDSPFCGAGA